MNYKYCSFTLALLLAGVTAWAQDPRGGGAGPGSGMPGPHPGGPAADFLMENFFRPEMVMHHQKAIGLTEDQQKAIREAMQKSLAQFTDLQWQESAERETLAGLLKGDRVDEKEVLTHLDKLLNAENQLKRLQLTLLIRTKNILTPEQQAQLRELQTQGPARGFGRGMMMGRGRQWSRPGPPPDPQAGRPADPQAAPQAPPQPPPAE